MCYRINIAGCWRIPQCAVICQVIGSLHPYYAHSGSQQRFEVLQAAQKMKQFSAGDMMHFYIVTT